jgi:hypothetical protein
MGNKQQKKSSTVTVVVVVVVLLEQLPIYSFYTVGEKSDFKVRPNLDLIHLVSFPPS